MGAIDVNASSTSCRKCGRAFGRLKGNFPISYGQLYKGSGYLPYCRECVDGLYNNYLVECGNSKDAVRQVCRKLDIYWDEKSFEASDKVSSSRSTMTAYITRVNGVKLAGKSYDDTLREEGTMWDWSKRNEQLSKSQAAVQTVSDISDKSEAAIEVPDEVTDFWGSDFEPAFVLKLDKRYKRWTDGEALDKGSVSLYKQICILEETINRDAAEGKPVDKNMNMLNTLLGSLNQKPVQKKSEIDAALETTPFGVWIDRWEHKRPIPEPDPSLKDVDGIIRYITVWFYGHISKALGIKNTYCDMYEKEMARMKVERGISIEEEDTDESAFNSIFGDIEV